MSEPTRTLEDLIADFDRQAVQVAEFRQRKDWVNLYEAMKALERTSFCIYMASE